MVSATSLVGAANALLAEFEHTRSWTFGEFKDNRRGHGVKPRFWKMYPKTWDRLKVKMAALREAVQCPCGDGERMSEESREYPTVKPGDTVTIEVTGIDGKVYRTKCQIVDSKAPRKAECGYCKDCKWWEIPYPAADGVAYAECSESLVEDLFAGDYPPATPPDFGCVQFEARA